MEFDQKHRKILDSIIKKIHQVLPNVMGIYLFGTFGSEYETKSSDIDIALLSQENLNKVELWDLAQEISSEVNRDVELIDLHEASTVFRFQILSSGQRIDCRNETSCAHFENLCYSMYLRFQEERKSILDDYKEGNRDHG